MVIMVTLILHDTLFVAVVEKKLKAAQELSENFEVSKCCALFVSYLPFTIINFLILQ